MPDPFYIQPDPDKPFYIQAKCEKLVHRQPREWYIIARKPDGTRLEVQLVPGTLEMRGL